MPTSIRGFWTLKGAWKEGEEEREEEREKEERDEKARKGAGKGVEGGGGKMIIYFFIFMILWLEVQSCWKTPSDTKYFWMRAISLTSFHFVRNSIVHILSISSAS